MIANVIDRRRRPYRWRLVRAIIEATWHDNSVADSDQAQPAEPEIDYDELNDVPLAEAIDWAHGQPGMVSLYIYDGADPASPDGGY